MTERTFATIVGPWTRQTNIDSSGALISTYAVGGFVSALAEDQARTALGDAFNHNALQLAHHSIEWYVHNTRAKLAGMTPLPPCSGWYSKRFDEAYTQCFGAGLYINHLFVTVVKRPPVRLASAMRYVGEQIRTLFGSDLDKVKIPYAERVFMEEFEHHVERIGQWLKPLNGVRQGLVERGRGRWFSEMDEAAHLIMNNFWRPRPVTRGRAGYNIMPYPMDFGEDGTLAIHVSPASERLAVMYGFENYPVATAPQMFDQLREADLCFTMTNSYTFERRSLSNSKLLGKIRAMKAAADPAKKSIRDLGTAQEKTAEGEVVWGRHHWSLAVHSRDGLEDLDRRAVLAESLLDNALAPAERETKALKSAYYGQLFGNRFWRTRPQRMPSEIFCDLGALHGSATAPEEGRWGPPIINLRTTAGGEYHWHHHVISAQTPKSDLGSFAGFGPSGSGKTSTFAGIVQLAAYRQGARTVVVDKGFGLAIMINANGGAYLVLQDGQPTGLAPLRGLTNESRHLAYLHRYIRMLIHSDGQPEISSREDDLLEMAIGVQMSMPKQRREMAGIAVALGYERHADGRDSARERLRKWCWGERLGWVADCREDRLDTSQHMMGYETSGVLKNTEVASPILNYILFRTEELIDGKPFQLFMDEYWSLDKNEVFAAANDEMLATIRKREGVVGFATQNVHTALTSRYAHTFRQQIPTKLHWADAEANVDELAEMGYTRPEIHAIKVTLAAQPHQFLVKRAGGSFIARFDMSGMPGHVAVVSGRDATYELMLDLKAKHGEEPRLWVPHFERLAPGLVDKPVMRKMDVVAA